MRSIFFILPLFLVNAEIGVANTPLDPILRVIFESRLKSDYNIERKKTKDTIVQKMKKAFNKSYSKEEESLDYLINKLIKEKNTPTFSEINPDKFFDLQRNGIMKEYANLNYQFSSKLQELFLKNAQRSKQQENRYCDFPPELRIKLFKKWDEKKSTVDAKTQNEEKIKEDFIKQNIIETVNKKSDVFPTDWQAYFKNPHVDQTNKISVDPKNWETIVQKTDWLSRLPKWMNRAEILAHTAIGLYKAYNILGWIPFASFF
jgi:hypothetical protein